jgi:hypothetical protein
MLDIRFIRSINVDTDFLQDGLSKMGLKSLHGKPNVRFFNKWKDVPAKAEFEIGDQKAKPTSFKK